MGGLSKRRSLPRLPWKRGPVTWKVTCRADKIFAILVGGSCNFLNLRRAARCPGVSTQPLRNWIRRNMNCLHAGALPAAGKASNRHGADCGLKNFRFISHVRIRSVDAIEMIKRQTGSRRWNSRLPLNPLRLDLIRPRRIVPPNEW